MKRALFISPFLFLVTLLLNAQSSLSDFVSPKNFTPPSPDVKAFAKYGNIPVSLNVGIPEITIPLYSIKSKKLEIPIALSYHAGGIKVDEIASVVGLGWTLNAGGVISRNVVSLPDESLVGILSGIADYSKDRQYFEGKEYNGEDFEYLANLSNGTWDSQSDIYNFNIPGISGKMFYDLQGNLHYSPIDKNIVISRDLNSWVIKDDNGNSYIFGATETTFNQQAHREDITAWHLLKIISADLTDTINFNYTTAQTISENLESYSFSVNTTQGNNAPCTNNGPLNYDYSRTSSYYEYKRLLISTIVFKYGRVVFEYDNGRLDPGKERLTYIKVYSNSGEIIKQWDLIHDYFVSNTDYNVDSKFGKRLKLTKLVLRGNDLTDEGDYQFEYNETPIAPYYNSNLFQIGRTTSIDYWGYNKFSGGTSTSGIKTLLPQSESSNLANYLNSTGGLYGNIFNIYNQDYSCNRATDPNAVLSGMLTKIIYPTGGITHFEYEPNRTFIARDGNDYVGGVRIKRIVSFSGDNSKPLIKTYSYGNTGQGYAMSPNLPDDYSYQNKRFQVCSGGVDVFYRFVDFKITASPLNSIRLNEGACVFYPQVTEYNGYPGKNEGKTEYTFEFEGDYVPSSSDNLKYWNFSTDKSWARGQLLNTKIYNNINNSYSLKKEIRNSYTTLKPFAIKTGYLCEQMSTFTGTNLLTFLNSPGLTYTPWEKKLLYHFEFFDVKVFFGIKKIIKTEEIDYENSLLSKSTNYFYESVNHLYPTKIEELNSKSELKKTVIRYPQDNQQITGLTQTAKIALNDLVNINDVSTPVETVVYINNFFSYKNRIDYKNFGEMRIYPEYNMQQIGNNTIEPRIVFKDYNSNGAITTLSQINNNNISYIWDDYGYFVIAKAENAKANEIAFTDFEPNNSGGWLFTGFGYTNSTFLSCKTSFNLSNGTISKQGLTPNKNYTISYWSKSGSANINNQLGTAVISKDGWTLYTHSIIATTVYITGNVIIDDLKLFPNISSMITYSYNPLVGVSSITDINNKINYFHYDNMGRLSKITDDEKNIIKLFEYKKTTSKLINWIPQESMNPNWVFTNRRCIVNLNGGYSGNEEFEYEDINIYSTTYKSKRWVFMGNTGTCPISCQNCNSANLKCINNICEVGIRVDTYSYFDSFIGKWRCVFHYEWSDGSWSSIYEEVSEVQCSQTSQNNE